MTRRKQPAEEPEFAARPAAEGTTVTVIVNDEERELKAEQSGDGWAIQPASAAEAAALERFGDEALNPPAPEQLAGEALDERVAELEIEGRSTMSADEKRAAIAEAEAAAASGEEAGAAGEETQA